MWLHGCDTGIYGREKVFKIIDVNGGPYRVKACYKLTKRLLQQYKLGCLLTKHQMSVSAIARRSGLGRLLKFSEVLMLFNISCKNY